jgi:GxxExxY protein
VRSVGAEENAEARRRKGAEKRRRGGAMPYDDEPPATWEPDAELNELSRSVIGVAIEVHRTLGPGLDESCYEEAMCIDFRRLGIPFQRQVIVDVFYKGEKIGKKRVDLIVGGRLVLELKTVDEITATDKAQLLTYLKLTDLNLGLLFNFNTAVLKEGLKRVIRA